MLRKNNASFPTLSLVSVPMNNLRLPRKIFVVAIICALFSLLLRPASSPALSEGAKLMGPPAPASGGGWVGMPAGGRCAYIGIHGGTVPVSLLTSKDGQSMVTLVGRTGNDFLSMLHKTSIRPPQEDDDGQQAALANNATVLMAETPVGSIPVFYATGKGFSRIDLADGWLPFGLAEKPLLLEGQAVKPLVLSEKKQKIRKMWLMQRWQRPVLSSR